MCPSATSAFTNFNGRNEKGTTKIIIVETTATSIKDPTVEISNIATFLIKAQDSSEVMVTEVDIEVMVIIIGEEAIDNITATITNNNKADKIRIRLPKIIALAKKAVK